MAGKMNEQIIKFIRAEAKKAYSALPVFQRAQTSKQEIFQMMKKKWKGGHSLTREEREHELNS